MKSISSFAAIFILSIGQCVAAPKVGDITNQCFLLTSRAASIYTGNQICPSVMSDQQAELDGFTSGLNATVKQACLNSSVDAQLKTIETSVSLAHEQLKLLGTEKFCASYYKLLNTAWHDPLAPVK